MWRQRHICVGASGAQFWRQARVLAFFGNADEDGEERADELDLLSLDPRPLAKAEGVVVEEIQIGANIDEESVRRLKYGVPDMKEFDIGEYLVYNELRLIAEELRNVDYESMLDAEKD